MFINEEIDIVYRKWLSVMELNYNELSFTLFIEDILKMVYGNGVHSVDIKRNNNIIYASFDRGFNTGFYETIIENEQNIAHYFNIFLKKLYKQL